MNFVPSHCVGLILTLWLSLPALALEQAQHPLDPLSELELLTAVSVLQAEGHVAAATRFVSISLDPPAKEAVLAWEPDMEPTRRAFVVLKQGTRTFEARVDLAAKRLDDWREVPGAMSSILLTEEWISAREVVKSHPAWRLALEKRGLAQAEDVVCVPMTVGRFRDPEVEGRRLVKVVCFDGRGARNFWTRPIEGLVATVDLEERRVIAIHDSGPIPIPGVGGDLGRDAVGKIRSSLPPFRQTRPMGAGFRVDGHLVHWQGWRFHHRSHHRVGPVVSLVHFRDGERWRPILYEGAVAELFVPYMDADEAWFFRTFMDAGEYGLGRLLLELEPDRDCPADAAFFPAVFTNESGGLDLRERASCLFERRIGDSAWRHSEAEHQQTEVRHRTELVLRAIPVVGNYDYVLDWVFLEDGTLRVDVTSSGVLQIKGVSQAKANSDAESQEDATGMLVAPHSLAVNHDHFFSFRLDLDVDGPRNRLVIDALRLVENPAGSHFRALWKLEPRAIGGEADARLRIDLEHPALWRVASSDRRSPLGHRTSYQVVPDANARNLLPEGAPSQRGAGFTQHHLWVTPYRMDERYAGGAYPNQAAADDGLSHWTRANRRILDTDIVVWYTLGFHHAPRPEDWPVMPSIRKGFSLRPFGFFTRNPALDLAD